MSSVPVKPYTSADLTGIAIPSAIYTAIISAILWFVAVIYSSKQGYSSNPGTPWLLWMLATAGVFYYFYRRIYDKGMRLRRHYSSVLPRALRRIDYYYNSGFIVMAIDIENRKIATASSDSTKFHLAEPYVFSMDKIRHVQAASPGRVVSGNYRSNQSLNWTQDTSSLGAVISAFHATGLYFDLDDIARPQVFVQMPMMYAERWLLILEKCGNGTLEKTTQPLEYPFPEQGRG